MFTPILVTLKLVHEVTLLQGCWRSVPVISRDDTFDSITLVIYCQFQLIGISSAFDVAVDDILQDLFIGFICI